MSHGFYEHCEHLWAQWLAGPHLASPQMCEVFDLNAAPEPYIRFGSDEPTLVVLTTNPGATMEHQRREVVMTGGATDPLHAAMSYSEAARRLGRFYSENLSGAARLRIEAQCDLAKAAGYGSVLQVECCPWHSKRLPNKPRILRLLQDDSAAASYLAHLAAFLSDRPVVALSAVSSNASLRDGEPPSRWLAWLAEMLGLDFRSAKFHPLTKRDGRQTSGAWVQCVRSAPKALVAMMGGNHFPSRANREALVAAIRTPA